MNRHQNESGELILAQFKISEEQIEQKTSVKCLGVRGRLAPNLGPGPILQERAPKIKNKFTGISTVVCCITFYTGFKAESYGVRFSWVQWVILPKILHLIAVK